MLSIPTGETQTRSCKLLWIAILVRFAAVMVRTTGLLFRAAAPGGMFFFVGLPSAAAERSGLARPFL